MLLRPRQKEMVGKIVGALQTNDNTLAIAPTGSGKTVMLSAAIGEMVDNNSIQTACVLQHRDELVEQNSGTFKLINPNLPTSIFNANQKAWSNITFAMVQTLSRESNLATMPKLDALVIDESHHACADSYGKVIDRARFINPDLKLLGVTATPMRGDKKGLRSIFDNVCDQITVTELIKSGHLVRPRTFIMDVGTQEALSNVKTTVSDYDMGEVADIMDKRPINKAIVDHWNEKAGDRQTVVFCSTVAHALNVAAAFNNSGIPTTCVHGNLSEQERKDRLNDYANGKYQVVTNVAVLTEGWDHPPTSCVILLRPSSFKSTLIQIIGRGLRTIDPKRWPGIVKTDCVILDFGTSTLEHGSIELAVKLDEHISESKGGESTAPLKVCPSCEAEVPARATECSLCGYVWELEDDAENISNFTMREVNILDKSVFQWCDAFGDGSALVACGFQAWSALLQKEDGLWVSVGGFNKGNNANVLASGEKIVCLAAANDWINLHESESGAHKSKRWLKDDATPSQLKYLPSRYHYDLSVNKYQASALMTLKFNHQKIKQATGVSCNVS